MKGSGSTALKYRLLRSQGHRVVAVPWREWEKRRGKEEELLGWLRRLMRDEKKRKAHTPEPAPRWRMLKAVHSAAASALRAPFGGQRVSSIKADLRQEL